MEWKSYYRRTCGLSYSGIHGLQLALIAIGLNNLLDSKWSLKNARGNPNYINIAITVFVAMYYLSSEWLPLGAHNSVLVNFLFVAGIVSVILIVLLAMVHYYEPILRWCPAQ